MIAAVMVTVLIPIARAQPAGTRSAPELGDPTAFLPADGAIPGWQLSGEPMAFTRANLWDHINGQAVHYLAYGFQRLAMAEYEGADGGGFVSLEIYAMADRDHAFGIYASERIGGEKPLAVGGGGYVVEGALNFWQGRCYVKLTAFDLAEEGAVMTSFAGAIATAIPGEPGEPGMLALLPRAHRVEASERFIPTNVLAQSSLRNGSLASYERGGDRYQLLLADLGSAAEASRAFAAYEAFLRKEGYEVKRHDEAGRRQMTAVKASVAVIFQRGHLVGGVLDADAAPAALAALKDLLVALENAR